MKQRIQVDVTKLKVGDICYFFEKSFSYYMILKIRSDYSLLLMSERGNIFNSGCFDPTGKDIVFLHTTNQINNESN